MQTKNLNAYQRWRMCDRKRSYFTKAKANRAAIRTKGRLYVYECPICACWHVTKRKPSD